MKRDAVQIRRPGAQRFISFERAPVADFRGITHGRGDEAKVTGTKMLSKKSLIWTGVIESDCQRINVGCRNLDIL